MNRSDKRKLRKLKQQGYLALKGVQSALAIGQGTEWYRAWLDMRADGTADDPREVIEDIVITDELRDNLVNHSSASDSVFFDVLLSDEAQAGYSNRKVLANWLRFGLNAKAVDVAQASDVSREHAQRVKGRWEEELRALLNDARCLHLSGEDLYHAFSTPHYYPTRLLERLGELRASRREAPSTGLLPRQLREDIDTAWRDYRVNASRRGCASDSLPVRVPKWFVKELTSVT